MSDLSRRDALKLMGLMAAASTFSFACSDQELGEAARRGADTTSTEAGALSFRGETQPAGDYQRQFFTDHEYETVRVLVDYIIPADDRSGSATDAGVPAFMDSVMSDELLAGRAQRQTAMRGGLAWIDYQCVQRYEASFVECSEAQQRELLDQIAYPEEAAPEMAAGVRFFNSFRDLTASGFFSSKMGMEDLQYMGNRAQTSWDGCPAHVLQHVGVSRTA